MTEAQQPGSDAVKPACDKIVADNAKNPKPATPEIGEKEILSPPDFVYGAKEIARFLGLNARNVYYLMELRKIGKSSAPINNLPGIGLCASRKALVDYIGGHLQA